MSQDIVLDPGHGGAQQRGNSSPDGARFGGGQLEKQVNWQLAQRVAAHLGGARLTRGEHENRALAERIHVARDRRSPVFVSLHSNPGAASSTSIWVHPRADPRSVQLAQAIRDQLGPVYGGAQVAQGELAVLSPEHHDRATAACLVDVGVGGNLEAAAAAIAGGVRGHLAGGVYGWRGTTGPRGLDNAPAPGVSASAWAARMKAFMDGVPDTTLFPFSAICRLQGTFDGSNWYSGTGFYIGPDRILTAGHCIFANGNVPQQLTVAPGRNGAVLPFGQFTITDPAAFKRHPSWTGNTGGGYRPDFDMGIIKIDPATQGPPGGLAFDLNSTPASFGPTAVCGYAARLFSSADPTPDSTKQHVDTDFIREVSSDANMDVVDYNAIIGYGTSGGPIFIPGAEDPQRQQCLQRAEVVAINVTRLGASGPSAIFNGGCRLTEAKVNWIWSV